MFRVYLYGGITIAIFLSAWYVGTHLYDKHILLPQRTIVILKANLKTVGDHLNICEANLSKQALDGFIEGVGEVNETVIINLDNLST